MIYGHNNTIHRTEKVNVEVDKDGKVVSVWFRCILLPFDQTVVDRGRAREMNIAYEENRIPRLLAVEVEPQVK